MIPQFMKLICSAEPFVKWKTHKPKHQIEIGKKYEEVQTERKITIVTNGAKKR